MNMGVNESRVGGEYQSGLIRRKPMCRAALGAKMAEPKRVLVSVVGCISLAAFGPWPLTECSNDWHMEEYWDLQIFWPGG